MRYVIERYKEQEREVAYRIYVTDCFRALVSGEENGIPRYADVLMDADTDKKPESEESAEEMANSIIDRIKRKVDGLNGDYSV